jgi:hypothetical protein
VNIFDRDGDGRLVVNLHAEEAQLLVALAGTVREAIQNAGGDDPISQRLFPRAYTDPTEEVAEQQWQAMVRDDLVAERVGALDDVIGRLPAELPDSGLVRLVLDDEGEAHLMGSVNDIRLALGAALGVTAESSAEDHQDDSSWVLYAWLTEFQEILVRFLLGDFSDPEE